MIVFIRFMEFSQPNAVGKQEVRMIPEGGCDNEPWRLSQIRETVKKIWTGRVRAVHDDSEEWQPRKANRWAGQGVRMKFKC